MRRSSSGWRSGSRAFRRNSGSSSMKSTPRWASVTSPGRIGFRPPRSAAWEMEQWGARTGRLVTSGRPSRRPATLWIIVTSIASSSASGGRIDGRRRASMVLPEPGGPMSSTLWPVPTRILSLVCRGLRLCRLGLNGEHAMYLKPASRENYLVHQEGEEALAAGIVQAVEPPSHQRAVAQDRVPARGLGGALVRLGFGAGELLRERRLLGFHL